MKKLIPCCLILSGCLYGSMASAQNLIPNPGFEIYNPRLANLEEAIPWEPIGTVDYFNSYMKLFRVVDGKVKSMPTKPYEGEAFAGFFVYAPGERDKREFIRVRLQEPISPQYKYRYTMYIKRMKECNYAISEYGVYFYNKEEAQRRRVDILKVKPQITTAADKVVSEYKEWEEFTGEFVPDGTFDYLMIGNFKDDRHTRFQRITNKGIPVAYYFVDAIELKIIDTVAQPTELPLTVAVEGPDAPSPKPLSFEAGKVYTFKQVHFDFDSTTMLPSAYPELDSLITFLKSNQRYKVFIDGHTDNQGSDDYNKRLSHKRAQSVVKYMVAQGIAQERLSYKGHGSEQPVVPNDSPAHRLMNRRVEFRLEEL